MAKAKYDRSGATVVRGRKDALTAVKCGVRGCEGYAQPHRTPDGRVVYTCGVCQHRFVLRKM